MDNKKHKIVKTRALAKDAVAEKKPRVTSRGTCDCGGDCRLEIRETWDGPVERWHCAHT